MQKAFWILGIVNLLTTSGTSAAKHIPAPPHHHRCHIHTQRYEKLHGIPQNLLRAVSLVESGKSISKNVKVAWPWTVNAEGKGYYFPTKEAAIAAVQRMQNQGVKSIDVGCMQVNLHHHPHAFPSLEDAFDPRQNVAYAAKFMTSLKAAHGSWTKAVEHYHSATLSLRVPYREIVMKTWMTPQPTPSPLYGRYRFPVWDMDERKEDFVVPTVAQRLARLKALAKGPIALVPLKQLLRKMKAKGGERDVMTRRIRRVALMRK